MQSSSPQKSSPTAIILEILHIYPWGIQTAVHFVGSTVDTVILKQFSD